MGVTAGLALSLKAPVLPCDALFDLLSFATLVARVPLICFATLQADFGPPLGIVGHNGVKVGSEWARCAPCNFIQAYRATLDKHNVQL